MFTKGGLFSIGNDIFNYNRLIFKFLRKITVKIYISKQHMIQILTVYFDKGLFAFQNTNNNIIIKKEGQFPEYFCNLTSDQVQYIMDIVISRKGSVPQGSCLGPLLFLYSSMIYAFHVLCTSTVSVSLMQNLLEQTVSWSSANKMIANIEKTKDIIISFPKQPMDIPPVTIQGIDSERVSSFKLSGIIINNKLTWTENTTYICSKASKRLYHLKQ